MSPTDLERRLRDVYKHHQRPKGNLTLDGGRSRRATADEIDRVLHPDKYTNNDEYKSKRRKNRKKRKRRNTKKRK